MEQCAADKRGSPGMHEESIDGKELRVITFFKVRDEFLISAVLTEISDQREFINLVFLVFRRMGVIKSPLLERDVSTDKI